MFLCPLRMFCSGSKLFSHKIWTFCKYFLDGRSKAVVLIVQTECSTHRLFGIYVRKWTSVNFSGQINWVAKKQWILSVIIAMLTVFFTYSSVQTLNVPLFWSEYEYVCFSLTKAKAFLFSNFQLICSFSSFHSFEASFFVNIQVSFRSF